MADNYDPMKDPAKHAAPDKTVADKVIELALGAGGGVVTLLSGLLAAVLIMYSGYVLYDTFATERAASSNAWDLLQFKPEIFDDYETPLAGSELKDINRDYRAWLTVYDTSIDYPVVHGQNDTYYAAVDIYGRPSLTGAIYLAAANTGDFSDSYNVIYGHHMDSGAMFGALDAMSGNETGVIVTENEIYDVQFFAVAHTDAYEGKIYSVGNRMNSVLEFLRSGGEGGVGVGTNVTYFNEDVAKDATKIVALSTCANANTSGRLVVFGKMTKRKIMIDVTVKKIWDDAGDQDGKRPRSLTVTLSSGETAILSEENDWTATLNVPKFDNLGEISYSWTEEAVSGYELSASVYDKETRTTTLTNVHTPETKSVSVKKLWKDDDDRDAIRPESVTAVLSNGMTIVLSEENGWSATIDDLPVYENGREIEYIWSEQSVEGYELTVDGDTLINTHIPDTTRLNVSKIWNDNNDQDGIRPSGVQVKLYGNDVLVGTVTLDEDSGWSGSIDKLYVNAGGKPIEYRWEEEYVDGYTLDVSTDGASTTLTNTHRPETVELSVSKIWDDNDNQDGIRPRSLRLDLSNGRIVTLNENNGWSVTVVGLPKYNAGREIIYTWTEEDVPGYEQVSSVTNGYGTVITNRHETDTTVATVIKVWNDDDDRDGIRPESITVTLSNGEERVLSPENNWTATVTGLPVNENGQPIDYTWSEEAVDGYTLSSLVSGTTATLTNTHEVSVSNLTVSKVWNDNDDQDGMRPDSVSLALSANGELVTSYVLSAANNWTVAAENQPVNAGGKPIAYAWVEEEIKGYEPSFESEGSFTTITNTHVPALTSLTVKKVWDDNDDQDGIRPESLPVTLSNGTQVTLSAENHWAYTVDDLPVYEYGAPIDYTWTEEDVDGYTSNVTASEGTTTIVNTHSPETTTLTVIKVWDDDNDRDTLRPSALKVDLLANGVLSRSATLNPLNGWSVSFDDLPVYANGEAIEYTWAEEEITGYELTTETDEKTTTLVNTHIPASVTLTVNKLWDDDDNRDGVRPDSITVTLRGDDETERQLTLSEEDGWSATIEVPANERGREIKYTWSEASISNYTGAQTVDGNTTTFTNTHAPATTARTVSKVWNDENDQDGVRPESLTVYLLANNERIQTVTLNAENNWEYTAESLYVYENGSAISYGWREENVPDYIGTTSSTGGALTVFTNTHEPELTELKVQKVWNDANNQDGIRPDSITVTLLADGEPVESVMLDAQNNWNASIADLPVYSNGAAITYAWDEGIVEGYTFDSIAAGNTTVITNTHETDTTVATVVKVWDDDNDRDGIRPESITVTLNTGDSLILSAENNWSGTIVNLPRFSDGAELIYSWSEDDIEGYEQIEYMTEGTVTVIMNRHEIATQQITVVKVWDDDNNRDGIRPERLEVTLNANRTLVLSDANAWTATVADQPIYANGGRVIIYRWTEETIDGYRLTRTVNGNVTTLTNTHESETVELSVSKVWIGDTPADRPASVNMVLSGGGEMKLVTLSPANDWTATVSGLKKYSKGSEIVYTWTEPSVAGYTQTSLITEGTNTIITNTKNAEPEPQEYTLTVFYRYIGGGTAAPTYANVYKAGDSYDVSSPIIPGYRATLTRVTGIMPSRSVEYTVIYIPIDNTVIIDDIDTPLGLGQVHINVGDCLE